MPAESSPPRGPVDAAPGPRPASRDVDVLVVGAGQAGLGTAFWLQRDPRLCVAVFDGGRVGQSWLERWDSLTLFTPRRFTALPGLPFPPGATGCPSGGEVAPYLQSYAERFGLPVETGVRVRRLSHEAGVFRADTSDGVVRARHTVVATGPFRLPRTPTAAGDLGPEVWQQHSRDYRRPTDVPDGHIVVVGGGNSAAQIAVELAGTRPVTLLGPRPPWYMPRSMLGVDTYWWLYLTGVLNSSTTAPVSRYLQRRGDPVVGSELRRLVRAGRVRLLPHRVVSCAGHTFGLSDGSIVHADAVLWCTGFRPDTSWIDISGATVADGSPVHRGGASPVPGLHWMGLPWQTRLNSSLVDGVDRDARSTARRIADALAG